MYSFPLYHQRAPIIYPWCGCAPQMIYRVFVAPYYLPSFFLFLVKVKAGLFKYLKRQWIYKVYFCFSLIGLLSTCNHLSPVVLYYVTNNFVSSVLQITLVWGKRRGLIVGLKLVMCLQISEDSPSNCFGTIRYILSGASEMDQWLMQDKDLIAHGWRIAQNVCPMSAKGIVRLRMYI